MAQTFTPQEIGQKLKQANPGKYDSYDDVQLANFYIEAKPQAKSAVLEQSAPVGVAKGVGKSALSAVKEASGLGERVLGSIAQTLLPKSVERAIGIDKKPTLGDMFKQQPQATSAQKLQTDVEQRLNIVPGSLTEARTGAQQVGKFTGDVAQFLAPTGLATRAGKAAQLASKASGSTKLAQFGARIAPQVASDVAVGTLQTGSPVEGLKAGAFSTAFPVAGAGLSKVASKIPKIQSVRLAERVVDSMVKPLKKFETYGKNPARGVVSEGITFNTLEEGAQKIGERTDSLVAELRNILTSPVNANKSIDLTGIGKIFDDQIDVLVKQNNVAGVNKLREAKRALTEDLGLIDGEIVSQGTKSLVLNPEKSIELKRMIGDMRTWTGQASEEKIVNKTLLDAYRLINNQVNKAVPSAEKLNNRISDLLSAKEAIIYRDQIASRANLLPLGARITGVVSLLAGVTTLNPLLIGVALADFGIDAALSSPAFKSRFAQWLAKANVTERQALSETVPALKPILDRIFVGEKKLTVPAIQRQLDDTYKEMLALPARGGTVPQSMTPDVINLPTREVLEGIQNIKPQSFTPSPSGSGVPKVPVGIPVRQPMALPQQTVPQSNPIATPFTMMEQGVPVKQVKSGAYSSNLQRRLTPERVVEGKVVEKADNLINEAKKYKTTINIKDKNDLDYLRRILSEDNIRDIQNGKMTNFRGESYEDLAKVNLVSETPKTINEQLAGKIKDVKLKSDTFYHGTSAENADSILASNFKFGSELPENTFRGGGYGQMQNSISFTETPKDASRFSSLTKNGKIIEIKLKPNSKVVSIDGIEDAVDLEEYISYLKKQKVDAVYIGGGEKELVVLNPKVIDKIKQSK